MTQTTNILIITNGFLHIEEKYKNRLITSFPDVTLQIVEDHDITPEMIKGANVIFGWPEIEQLHIAENLRWLHLPSAGVDGYASKELYLNKEILLTNSSGVYGIPIAEHVFAMILAFNRDLQAYANLKNESKWHRIDTIRDFYGSTLGIIGLGDIGNEVAKRAKALGARVLAVKRTLTQVPEYVDKMYTLDTIDEVLEVSDYVVLALPHTTKTEKIISEARLRKMKPDSFLVNIGRGILIDQDALIVALTEKWIGGAGLDVTTPEPLPEESPLWSLPNVIITPHTSGLSPSNDGRRFEIFYRNLEAYLAEQPLENSVDFVEGY